MKKKNKFYYHSNINWKIFFFNILSKINLRETIISFKKNFFYKHIEFLSFFWKISVSFAHNSFLHFIVTIFVFIVHSFYDISFFFIAIFFLRCCCCFVLPFFILVFFFFYCLVVSCLFILLIKKKLKWNEMKIRDLNLNG